MHNVRNGGQTNLSEWFQKTVDEFCEEKVIEECTSFDDIKYRFHENLHDIFMCTIPTLLFKFLIDKATTCIIEPQLPLTIPYFTYWNQRKR